MITVKMLEDACAAGRVRGLKDGDAVTVYNSTGASMGSPAGCVARIIEQVAPTVEDLEAPELQIKF